MIYFVTRKVEDLKGVSKLRKRLKLLLGKNKEMVEFPTGYAMPLNKEEYSVLHENGWKIIYLIVGFDPYGLIAKHFNKSP